MDFLSDNVEFEQVLMQSKECFVYKVPPLTTASGHRAETFGLDHPLFTGHLKVIQSDVKLRICLYRYKDETTLLTTPENLIFFGECPIEIQPKGDITPFADSVADSSRYFVIRIKDPASKRSVSIGIGFRERETAFDFKTSLNEYVRYIDRMALAEEMSKNQHDILGDDETQESGPVKQMKDMTLKEGARIHIKTKGVEGKRAAAKTSGGGFLGLKPPPPAGSIVHIKTPEEIAAASAAGSTSGNTSSTTSQVEDEWGELTSTTSGTTITSGTGTDTSTAKDDDWGDFSSFS